MIRSTRPVELFAILSEADDQIFNLLGQPNDEVWPGFSSLPVVKNINPIGPPYVPHADLADDRFSTLRQRFKPLSSEGHHLLSSLLMYDPERRISAIEALEHQYFKSVPFSFPFTSNTER